MAFINIDVLMDRTGGDPVFAREILGIFEQELKNLRTQMQESRSAGDEKRFHRVVHTLKGSVGNFGVQVVAKLAMELEKIDTVKDQARADVLYTSLERALDGLQAEIPDAYERLPKVAP